MKQSKLIKITALMLLSYQLHAVNPAARINAQTWQNLCPPNTRLSKGCYPDCTPNGSLQSKACKLILQATNIEGLQGIAENLSINGLYAMSFTPNGANGSSLTGPTVTNNISNFSSAISCLLFSSSGVNISYPQAQSLIVINHPLSFNLIFAGGNGLPANTTYYLLCQGFDTGGITTNVPVNVTASW